MMKYLNNLYNKVLHAILFGKKEKGYDYYIRESNLFFIDYEHKDLINDGYEQDSNLKVVFNSLYCRYKRPVDFFDIRRIKVKLDLDIKQISNLHLNAVIETPGMYYNDPITIEGIECYYNIWTLTFNQPLPEIFNIKLDHLIICNQNTHRYDNN